MNQRYSYKLRPSKMQHRIMTEWLNTLRKHRNFALRERIIGYESNNQDANDAVVYGAGAYCTIGERSEWLASCPLTCPVLKHGVLSNGVELIKRSKGLYDGARCQIFK